MVASSVDPGILQRLLDSPGREISQEVARFFLGLSLSESDQQRIQFLSEKANEGDLTNREREDLAVYIVLGDLLAIMHAKARAAVKGKSPTA